MPFDARGPAEQAGVAVQTLYFTFHTEAQLLKETLDRATDVLFVLLGPDTFRAFIHGRGWPLDPWKAWVTTALERDLFTPWAG